MPWVLGVLNGSVDLSRIGPSRNLGHNLFHELGDLESDLPQRPDLGLWDMVSAFRQRQFPKLAAKWFADRAQFYLLLSAIEARKAEQQQATQQPNSCPSTPR